jgi:hypothetical protein
MNMKKKYKKVYEEKNCKIQHVYLIFKYRTKIQFMQKAILLISLSNNIFPNQINSQIYKSIKVHAEQMSNPPPL